MRLLAMLAAGLFVVTLMAEDKKDVKKAKDEDALIGTWKPERIEVGDSKALAPEQFAKLTYEYRSGGEMSLCMDGKAVISGTYTLDPAADPRAIDQTTPDGNTKRTEKGVYRLDSDTLTLCLPANYGPDRPTEFKAVTGKTILITLKRVKGEKNEDKKGK